MSDGEEEPQPSGVGLATGGSIGLFLGALLGGPAGAVIGGIIGAMLGHAAEEEQYREE